MFEKLFGRKDAPIKRGKISPPQQNKATQWVKKITLELSNMERTPSYALTHQLTIGSEAGNIIVADPSVSPRHCTFVLQDEVVSVMDHSSVSGTLVNGKKIPPGRSIILEETDTVKVGDLEVRIIATLEQVVQEKISERTQVDIQMDNNAEIIDLDSKDGDLESAKKIKVVKDLRPQKKKEKKFSLSPSEDSPYATNVLVRVMAVTGDILWAYILFVIFSPFDEFKAFIYDLPIMLGEIFHLKWNEVWNIINRDYAFAAKMSKDLYTFLSSNFHIFPIVILFILIRAVSVLLFGTSLSEMFLGVRSHGSIIWKRVGGLLRTVIGIFTGPLLVLDLGAIISRRTFKEFITYTHTYVHSKFITTVSVILYFPLLVSLALLSPLLQGLELPELIPVKDTLDKKIQAGPQNESGQEKIIYTEFSKFLNLEIKYDPQILSMTPVFKLLGHDKKLNYKSSLVFLNRSLQRSVEFEVFKNFDLKELLAIGIRGNYFLYEKYPEIYQFVYSQDLANSVFKKAKNDESSNRKFASEVLAFTKSSFELTAENAFEFIQTETPLLKGVLDYKASFLSLVEYKDFDLISFVKLGNAYFLRMSYSRPKPFDLLIPLIKGEGRIFKVDYDKKENLNSLVDSFYHSIFNHTDWFSTLGQHPRGETLKPLQVLDFFSQLDPKSHLFSAQEAQALYGHYYENSAKVLNRQDILEMEIWKKSIASIFMILEKFKDSPAPLPDTSREEGIEDDEGQNEAQSGQDLRIKLYQNFRDLKDAFENNNQEYFGVAHKVRV